METLKNGLLVKRRQQLIRRCRSHNPAHRPTFEQIKKFVHRINPVKVSPVDMMMNLLEEIGGYVLQCRGMMQVKGKGDMVTYWLEGKKTSLVSRDISQDDKTTKHINMETETEMEKERELYSSIPGFLNDDLLLGPE